MFEDDLGKYMLPYKIIAKTFGKNNQLFSKDMPKEYGISYGNAIWTIGFPYEEKIFNCEMSGKIIDSINYKLLADELRKNNLLK